MPEKTWVETLHYPKGLVKLLFKTPILLYRLGLGVLVRRLFMALTTTGRKSGQPRRTAIEFHEFEGKPTVMSGWGEKTDWYRNLAANPLATVQTWRGAQSVRARRIESEEELRRAFAWAQSNPTMKRMMKLAGFAMTPEQFHEFPAVQGRCAVTSTDPEAARRFFDEGKVRYFAGTESVLHERASQWRL